MDASTPTPAQSPSSESDGGLCPFEQLGLYLVNSDGERVSWDTVDDDEIVLTDEVHDELRTIFGLAGELRHGYIHLYP